MLERCEPFCDKPMSKSTKYKILPGLVKMPAAMYTEFVSSPRLSRYVECYWSRDDARGKPDHWVVPDGCVDILFSQRDSALELSVVGLMTVGKKIEIVPGQSFFGVRFRPGMAAAFIPDVVHLTDKIEPVENIIGAAGRRLCEKLVDVATFYDKAAVMEQFLRPLEPADKAQRVFARLTTYELSVDQAAAESGFSVRQLRRVCMDRSGISPKYLTRILRFRRAAEGIASAASDRIQPNWAGFAAACGYFDQAHFIREFQGFMGFTPGRYLRSLQSRTT
jgi:AraC-like DNA-binding protein